MTRRPIKTRGAAWVQSLARGLAGQGITPNQISVMSMVFAALAWCAFRAASLPEMTSLAYAAFVLFAALCIQLRLLCNLLDGLVAVEGGKSAADGPFWNEAPDRAADLLILSGLGVAAGSLAMGLLAGAFAVTTAYVRELGRAEGMDPDFSGPFAKPQRMAAATLAAVISGVAALIAPDYTALIFFAATTIIAIGTGVTVLLRSYRLIGWMKAR